LGRILLDYWLTLSKAFEVNLPRSLILEEVELSVRVPLLAGVEPLSVQHI